MKAPNIIYIHSHDTGRYVQPYGHAIATPHIQKLAEQGILFRQAFCAAPTCSPSRAALLTGQSAHSSGMLGLAHRGFSLHDERQHLAHTLQQAGYQTAQSGVQHLGPDAAKLGYQRLLAPVGKSASQVAAAAAGYLRQGPPQPFFLDVGFFETHRDFPEPGAGEDPRHARPPQPLPDTKRTREDMAAYQASARQLDQGIGSVLEALQQSGRAEDTLVVCTTDHGIAFPGMKCNLSDHGLGVMLIIRGPGGFSGGRVCDALVSHIDLFPTLCNLGGLQKPPWLQGRSILPLVRGEAEKINEEVYGEVSYHAAYEPQRAVRTKRWKYIRRFGDRTLPVRSNCDDGPSKEEWLAAGWGGRPVPQEQLYDLVFDPLEGGNRALDPAAEPVLEEMRSRLQRWMRATGDPLLQGPVPAPTGAQINDPDDLSPRAKVRVVT